MGIKGIVLAGGSGTRLYPLTKAISKQLLPVYDKPTIHFPVSTLMLAGIKDILIISTPRDLPMIRNLFGDGSQLGINFEYAEQAEPRGIAEAFIIGDTFCGDERVCLILGDNLFYGSDMLRVLQAGVDVSQGASIFAYRVSDPERYGVVEVDATGKAISIEEKPDNPKSSWAVTGLYIYDNSVLKYARELKPSARGELEITDLNQRYLKEGKLRVQFMGRGFAWLDTGTFDSLLESSQFVQTMEKRQGLKIASLEEIAYSKGWIDAQQLGKLAESYPSSEYGKYLKELI